MTYNSTRITNGFGRFKRAGVSMTDLPPYNQ